MKNHHLSSEDPVATSLITPRIKTIEKQVRSESLSVRRFRTGCVCYGFWLCLFTLLLTAQPSLCDGQYISSLNAKVTGLRFYEGDASGPPHGKRNYSTVFSKSASRYIYWELKITFPKPNRTTYFNIVSKYYNPHGNFMTRLTTQGHIEPGWTGYHHHHGYGWKRPGNWETGTYRVDIFVDNQKVTSGTFTITYGGMLPKRKAPTVNDADIHFEKGMDYSHDEKWDEAIVEFTKAIALNPKDSDAYISRGLAYEMKGQDEKAVADYGQAIKLNTKDVLAYYNRGLIHLEKGRYDKAVADYDQALNLKPEYTDVYYSRGLTYHKMGKYEKAISDYTECIKINPNDVNAYFGRGYSHYYKGEYGKAIRDYDEALKISPKYTNVYYNRGLAHHKKGRYKEAVADYDQAIQLNPKLESAKRNRELALKKEGPDTSLFGIDKKIIDFFNSEKGKDKTIADHTNAIERDPKNPDLYIARGDAYFDKGKDEEAIADYTEAIRLNPKETEAYLIRADAYFWMGEDELAIADYNKAIQLKPKDAELYLMRGDFYFDLGEDEKAIADYTKALKLKPKDTEIYSIRASTYSVMGEYDEAIADYSRIIKLKPEDAQAYYYRGDAYREKKKYKKAIADYDRAIELKPEFANAYNSRGLSYFKEGEYDTAITDYTQVLKLNPKNFGAHNNRGKAYYQKGSYEKAIADYTQAIKLKPKFADAFFNRGLAHNKIGDDSKALEDIEKSVDLGRVVDLDLLDELREASGVEPPQGDKAETYFQRGKKYYKKKNWDMAIAEFERAIKHDSKNADIYYNRGMAYAKKKEYDNAVKDYGKAIKYNPKFGDAYEERGDVYSDKGEYERAIADYTQAIKLEPYLGYFIANFGLSGPYKKRAKAYYERAKFGKAWKDVLRIRELGGGVDKEFIAKLRKVSGEKAAKALQADLHCYDGMEYLRKKEWDKAIAELGKAIDLNRKHAEAYYSRGKAYDKKKEYDSAVKDYGKGIKYRPTFVDAYLKRGDAYYNIKEYEKAVDDYTQAIELQPQILNFDTLFGGSTHEKRAKAYYEAGEYGKAWKDLLTVQKKSGFMDQKLIEKLRMVSGEGAPKTIQADARYFDGVVYGEKKRWDEAIVAFDKVIGLDRKYAEAYYGRGLVYSNKGEYDKAIVEFDQAIKLKRKSAVPYNYRGLTYRRKGENEKAIADYTYAIKLEPEYADPYNNRGYVYYTKGEYDRAITDHTEAIKLKPKYALAYLNRGNAYLMKGEDDKAISDYDQAIKQRYKYPLAYFNRARVYIKKSNYDKALEDLEKAVKFGQKVDPALLEKIRKAAEKGSGKTPENTSAKQSGKEQTASLSLDAFSDFAKGQARMDEKLWDDAIVEFTKVIALEPEFGDAYNQRGLAYYRKGQFDKAISDFDRVLKIDPKNAQAYYQRGNAYRSRGEYDKAIADYAQTIKLGSAQAVVYHNRGGLYIVKGEYEKAIADLTQAIELDSSYALAYYNRGVAHKESGGFRKALEDVERAVDLGHKVDAEFLAELHRSSKSDQSSSSGADTLVSESREGVDKNRLDLQKPQDSQEEAPSKPVKDLNRPTGEKEDFISSINGSVTGLRFYESGSKDRPYGERTYQTVFPQSGARYIYWEITLAFSKLNRKRVFDITAKYYDPHGDVVKEWVRQSNIEPGWSSSYHNSGYGWNQPGNWRLGSYRVELSIDGQRVASGSFTVTSGNVPLENSPTSARQEDVGEFRDVEQINKSAESGRKLQERGGAVDSKPIHNPRMVSESEVIVIPSINARLVGLRFYETGNSWKPSGQGGYGTSFPRSTTRNINWELSLTFPPLNRKSYFSVTAEYYGPHGDIIIRQTREFSIQPGRSSSTHFHGYGWGQPGNWEAGTYRVDITVEGKKVASGSFTITH